MNGAGALPSQTPVQFTPHTNTPEVQPETFQSPQEAMNSRMSEAEQLISRDESRGSLLADVLTKRLGLEEVVIAPEGRAFVLCLAMAVTNNQNNEVFLKSLGSDHLTEDEKSSLMNNSKSDNTNEYGGVTMASERQTLAEDLIDERAQRLFNGDEAATQVKTAVATFKNLVTAAGTTRSGLPDTIECNRHDPASIALISALRMVKLDQRDAITTALQNATNTSSELYATILNDKALVGELDEAQQDKIKQALVNQGEGDRPSLTQEGAVFFTFVGKEFGTPFKDVLDTNEKKEKRAAFTEKVGFSGDALNWAAKESHVMGTAANRGFITPENTLPKEQHGEALKDSDGQVREFYTKFLPSDEGKQIKQSYEDLYGTPPTHTRLYMASQGWLD
ncbi:hypothetical protein [Endozoicomonas atrinae]|uniref:hypothetical protein n=1 Tax=Endozoicomonas atrinae TaxID=1333660 RepID=UPI003B005CE6